VTNLSRTCVLASSATFLLATTFASPITRASAMSNEPQLVSPGVISTIDDEFGFVVSPDGRRALFVKRTPTTNTPPLLVVCETERTGNGWSTPHVAAFSGRFNDFGLAFGPDGRLFFTSNRPHDESASGPAGDFDIWVVARVGTGWGTPVRISAPINTEAFDGCPSLAADGTLYFASSRPGGKGSIDLYRARPLGDSYAEPENLSALNTENTENQPAIAPDQSLLVFTGTNRHEMLMGGGAPYPRSDLYVARADSGTFLHDAHLAAPTNSTAGESNASFSSDGAWLYFSSERSFATVPMAHRLTAAAFEKGRRSIENGFNNIYRVPAAALRSAGSAR
jgi:Tol biopolymer transport system component